MNKSDVAKRLAKQTNRSTAEAADQVDRVVNRIVSDLRKGRPAQLPGLGRFRPGEKWRFQFDPGGERGGK